MLPWVAASCDVFGDRFFWLSVTIAVSHVWCAGGSGGGPDRVPVVTFSGHTARSPAGREAATRASGKTAWPADARRRERLDGRLTREY